MNMTDALIWMLALGGAFAVFIIACVLAWAFVQEINDD
jgi:hypothetical protein